MLSRALRDIRDGLLGLTHPEECRVCAGAVESWDDGVACAECWNDPEVTRILTGSVCAKCGSPLAPAITNSQSSLQRTAATATFCGRCTSAPFAAARACGVYSGALEASILFLKVSPHICPRLRAIIHSAFAEHRDALTADIVMPVPLHRVREQQRGFNQAAIIARLISRESGLRFDDRSLQRIKPTERHRAGMDASDRSHSVERAFEVMRQDVIDGVSVLLVDDLLTTGSTISAAAQTLLAAGAKQVNVLTIARVGDS